MKFLERRRQDESADDVAAGKLEQLLRALPVDVEQADARWIAIQRPPIR